MGLPHGRRLLWCSLWLAVAGCERGQGSPDAGTPEAAERASPTPPGGNNLQAPTTGQPMAPATGHDDANSRGAGHGDFSAPISVPLADGPAPPFVGMQVSQDEVLNKLQRAEPLAFWPVGSTSTVFRTRLRAPFLAAFKSATQERPRGPAAEVAAYRLGRCLGLRNIPPAVSRWFPEETLRTLYRRPSDKPRWGSVSKRLKRSPGGAVRGVMIYWVPDLTDLGLDQRAGVARWAPWLKQGSPAPEEPALAAHISTMLVFDYLIGNFDRFSGSNAQGRPDRSTLYLRDHDVAFPARMREPLHRRVLDRMLRAERFSRSFYRQLTVLDRVRFEAELGQDPAAREGPLLSKRRIDGVFERLQTVTSHIASLVALYGESAVLPFP